MPYDKVPGLVDTVGGHRGTSYLVWTGVGLACLVLAGAIYMGVKAYSIYERMSAAVFRWKQPQRKKPKDLSQSKKLDD